MLIAGKKISPVFYSHTPYMVWNYLRCLSTWLKNISGKSYLVSSILYHKIILIHICSLALPVHDKSLLCLSERLYIIIFLDSPLHNKAGLHFILHTKNKRFLKQFKRKKIVHQRNCDTALATYIKYLRYSSNEICIFLCHMIEF